MHGRGMYRNEKKLKKQGIWENGKISKWKEKEDEYDKTNKPS